MNLIFKCPYCGFENEQDINSEYDIDYIADDEKCEVDIECKSCDGYLKAYIDLQIKKIKGD